MRLVLLVVGLLGVGAPSCALRPRYKDFVSSSVQEKTVLLLMTDEGGVAIPNAKIEMSELKNRVQLTTGADGTFPVPVEKRYHEENPIMVVQLPSGFRTYRIALAPPKPLPEIPKEAPEAQKESAPAGRTP